jgi:hypothetical protein
MFDTLFLEYLVSEIPLDKSSKDSSIFHIRTFIDLLTCMVLYNDMNKINIL